MYYDVIILQVYKNNLYILCKNLIKLINLIKLKSEKFFSLAYYIKWVVDLCNS